MVIPLKCGPDKLVIYDPEISQTACYRYALIEIEQANLPPLLPVEDNLPLPDVPERRLPEDTLESVTAQPSILDADAAGGAYGPNRYGPNRLSLEDAIWVNAKIAEDLSRGRINHAPHFMAMVRKTLEEPHVAMAREAVERAKQRDRARL